MHVSTTEIASTSIIYRPFGIVAGYRQITDRATRVGVHAFPSTMLQQVSAAGLLASAGAYILTDFRTAYIGESNRPARRLAEHALDPEKRSFAQEIFVVGACDGCAFDKPLAMDLQFRLTKLATEAGRVSVSKGSNPTEPQLSMSDRSTHDRIFADALRLLADAGCHIFASASDACPAHTNPTSADDQLPEGDGGPMEIGIQSLPVGAEEYELRYLDIWARGYFADGHFIVTAGSEIRTQTNGSCDIHNRRRRDELLSAGVLAQIPGVNSRRRLMAAVAFPSNFVAAKVVCGAHTASRWVPLARPRVVVLRSLRQ